jgi:hypothetical protein
MQTLRTEMGSTPSPLAAGFAIVRDKISETNLQGVVATIVCCTCDREFVLNDEVTIALHNFGSRRPSPFAVLRSKRADG